MKYERAWKNAIVTRGESRWWVNNEAKHLRCQWANLGTCDNSSAHTHTNRSSKIQKQHREGGGKRRETSRTSHDHTSQIPLARWSTSTDETQLMKQEHRTLLVCVYMYSDEGYVVLVKYTPVAIPLIKCTKAANFFLRYRDFTYRGTFL